MTVKARIGIAIVVAVCLVAVLAPVLSPHDPSAQDIVHRNLRPWLLGGTFDHPLGTDALGRDILSRLIYGARISLLIGVASVVVGGVVGVIVGLLAGYFGGIWDTVAMRTVDLQMTMPFLVLAIAVVAVLGASLRNIIIVLALTVWTNYARVVRAQVLVLRDAQFVQAARVAGATDLAILRRHVLPAIVSPVVAVGTLQVGQMILTEAGLSFLGLGVPSRVITWGQIAADGRDYLTTAWWITTAAGLAIFVSVLGISLVGDWLVDRRGGAAGALASRRFRWRLRRPRAVSAVAQEGE